MPVCKLHLCNLGSKKIVLCLLHVQDQMINEFNSSNTFRCIFGYGVNGRFGKWGDEVRDQPIRSWKGEKLVLMFMVFIMLNCTCGSALAQPF